MPREFLDDKAQAGFFGKLPATGDFVARGLPRAFRNHWDAWITGHLAARLKDGSVWPEGGLRFRLVSGGRVAAGVIVPGGDSAGRLFPLSLLLIGTGLPDPAGLDAWCDAALAAAAPAMQGQTDADALQDMLEMLPAPGGKAGEAAGMVIWTASLPPTNCDPAQPDDAITLALTSPQPEPDAI